VEFYPGGCPLETACNKCILVAFKGYDIADNMVELFVGIMGLGLMKEDSAMLGQTLAKLSLGGF
jgi:hypothetical protein